MNFSIEQIDKWIDSFKGYRIPERETAKTPYDKSLIGKTVAVKRVVIRAGYRLMPEDALDSHIEDLCLEYTQERCGLTIENVKAVVDALDLANPYRHIRYGVLGAALAEMKTRYLKRCLPENLRLRTFWYVDYNTGKSSFYTREDGVLGDIDGVVHRQIGTQVPGREYGGFEYYDYEPAYLQHQLTQPLYSVHLFNKPDFWRTPKDIYIPSYRVLVHPLDVMVHNS